MASTNKTTNLQLNQWVATDPVLMVDFNADNNKIDTAFGNLQSSISAAGNCRIMYGTYTGTGLVGPANPTSITFTFNPKLVIISCNEDSRQGFFFIPPLKSTGTGWYTVFQSLDSTSNGQANFNTTTHKLTWYYSNSANFPNYQFNSSNTTYYWIAIG